jgi:methylated-DNA-[protein]-cysteine S-methyltransferase
MSIRLVDGSYAAPYQTSWGEGWVYVRDGELAGVDLPGEAGGPCKVSADCPEVGAGGEPGGAAGPAAPDAEALTFWVGELEAYFRGERTTWTPEEVPLGHLGLGVFEETVYEALLAVPPGETVTYGELAEMAGYPRAARAVGNAMANNPIPVVVPCHRVVRSNGTLGNYGNDPRWKERLLKHEGWTCAGSNAGGSAERG